MSDRDHAELDDEVTEVQAARSPTWPGRVAPGTKAPPGWRIYLHSHGGNVTWRAQRASGEILRAGTRPELLERIDKHERALRQPGGWFVVDALPGGDAGFVLDAGGDEVVVTSGVKAIEPGLCSFPFVVWIGADGAREVYECDEPVYSSLNPDGALRYIRKRFRERDESASSQQEQIARIRAARVAGGALLREAVRCAEDTLRAAGLKEGDITVNANGLRVTVSISESHATRAFVAPAPENPAERSQE